MPALLIVSHGGKNTIKTLPLALDPEFAAPRLARLRQLEINRLLIEAFTAALDFTADNPISNDTLIMISFEGIPATEGKE